MTTNQLYYHNMVENRRHDLETEQETHRHNVETEVETNRHNVVYENETQRHNEKTEAIGHMQVQATYASIAAQRDIAALNASTQRYVAELNSATQKYNAELNSSTQKYTANLNAHTTKDVTKMQTDASMVNTRTKATADEKIANINNAARAALNDANLAETTRHDKAMEHLGTANAITGGVGTVGKFANDWAKLQELQTATNTVVVGSILEKAKGGAK